MNIEGPDLVNSVFEVVAGALTWTSVFRLRKDKRVRGIHLAPMAVFAAWGYWNMFYYLHLNQPLSWIAGCSMTAANTVWFLMALYYSRKERAK